MPYKLPKAAQTRKLNSLPDDLKKIAEKMIADKFGIEEEVTPKRGDTFRQEYGTFGMEFESTIDMAAAMGRPTGYGNSTRGNHPADDFGLALELMRRNMRLRREPNSFLTYAHTGIRMYEPNTGHAVMWSFGATFDDRDMRFNPERMVMDRFLREYREKVYSSNRLTHIDY